MPVTTRAAVVAMAPELAAIPEEDARWESAIADAEREMNAAVWGGLLEQGARYLVAHKLSVSKTAGTSSQGQMQSYSAGGISISYAAPVGLPGEYTRTPYGAEYKRLQRIVGGGPAR